ncbi:isoquinoline 1-oxidoreductase alpha subunit [Luminiphilus syltensis NOR5-1B]|uniref:Isoquinoline 1-oxidoreductase alpha subunit n=1 Tax=Luminiphilus syltensis NOR5-1B TaxID=565045 RepID=B8KU19_9GAMM|nr:(2Fe-2S)-binding protein [Luminiphilus syltensis]EED35305.1 isoquinoline 1-oxidoreductase alpha subunit [Luminiphilus syltensis NOR5-1B]
MIKLTVNGVAHQFDGDTSTPVLWFLRDELNLTGTKFGCGAAQCGACTVHVDGKAQRSCVLPISAVDGASLTTIEGLDPEGNHPLQKAWIEHQVPQCGYCQGGQIMQAASLLDKNPSPSDQDIVDAMSGNLCRCGTYTRIHKAIKSVAASTLSQNDSGVQQFEPATRGRGVVV